MNATAAAVETPSPAFWAQVHRMIRWLKIIFFVLVGVFFLILLAEAVRLYKLAADVHPLLGYASIILMAGAVLLIAVPARRYFLVPRAVMPPGLPESSELEIRHLRAEVRYLSTYLACCERNPELEGKAAEIRKAAADLALLSGRIRRARPEEMQQLSEELSRWTASAVPAVLEDVDTRAERLIYQEALNVGLGTAASPNGTLDAFVMLWRSVHLISRLAVLYYGRPGVWGTLMITKDVAIATAAAAYLQSVSDSLGSILAKSIGGMTSVVAGPAFQGITNSLVLIRIGYLAQERCRSFREWDAKARESALAKAVTATQKVAVGLTSEILRKMGSGLGAAAGAAASGVSQVVGAAADGIASAAESAFGAASELGQKISAVFKGKKEPETTESETTEPEPKPEAEERSDP